MAEEEISSKEFGALQADVKNLRSEIALLRKEMANVNAMLNQGKGGLYMVVFTAGALGAVVTLFAKKLFGSAL